jgi:hypothetical protein
MEMAMFLIKFYVDDKSLGEAFKRLAGLARGIEHAYVPNLAPTGKANGHEQKVKMTAADSAEMFVKEVHKKKLTTFNAAQAREIVVGMGFSPTSYSYVLRTLNEQGVLKRSGTAQKMVYTLKTEK